MYHVESCKRKREISLAGRCIAYQAYVLGNDSLRAAMAIADVADGVAGERVDSDVVAGHPGLAVHVVSNVYIDDHTKIEPRTLTRCRPRCG
jgi:hypothetical protein